jgi:hypothetical protein
MFRRYKKGEGAPNKLIDQAEINKLTWTSGDGTAEGDVFPEFEDQPDDADNEDEAAEDTRTPAERAAALKAELDREAQEYGLLEQDPTELYGPSGEDVASLLDDLADMDDETAEAIADAYEAAPTAERKVAQSVVRRRHRGGEREDQLWAAEHAVADWLAAMQLDGDELALYSIVADAATDAVHALVLEDELADVDFETLYGPWSEAMDSEEDDEAPTEGEEPHGEESAEAKPARVSRSRKGETADDSAANEDQDVDAEEAAEGEAEGEFGPNTELVMQLLTKLAALTAAETTELVAAWRKQPKEDLSLAHRNLQALVDEERRWREQMHLAQDEVFAWLEGRNERRDYSFGGSASLARVREIAGPPVADAVAAMVMADILEPEDAATLYAPWADAIGEPELPMYEDEAGD